PAGFAAARERESVIALGGIGALDHEFMHLVQMDRRPVRHGAFVRGAGGGGLRSLVRGVPGLRSRAVAAGCQQRGGECRHQCEPGHGGTRGHHVAPPARPSALRTPAGVSTSRACQYGLNRLPHSRRPSSRRNTSSDTGRSKYTSADASAEMRAVCSASAIRPLASPTVVLVRASLMSTVASTVNTGPSPYRPFFV